MQPASRPVVLAAVFSSCLGVGLIFGFQPPLIALALSRAGSSNFAIGAVTAASLLAVVLLGPLYPRLLVRLGLKRAVVVGVTAAASILAIMPLWPDATVWLILRSLTGCALGLCWIGSEVWLNGVAGATARGTVMGMYGTVFSFGVMAGPALLEATGTRGWQPFAIGAACLMLTLLPLLILHRVDSAPQAFTPMRALGATILRAPVVMLAAFVAGSIESAELTLLPLFGVHSGMPDREALLMVSVFMAGNVALQVPIGLLSDRHGRGLVLGACAVSSALGPLFLQPSLVVPVLLWPLLFLWGGTLYAFYTQGVALLGVDFAPAELPTANTVFVMMYCLGGIIGPSVGGMAMDAWPRYGLQAVLSSAAFLLLGALVTSAAWRAPEV